jgi:hypothetical protein
MGDDANQPVDGFPTLFVLHRKGSLWDVLGLSVEKLGDLGGQSTANLTQIPLLAVLLEGIAASAACFRVFVEFPEALLELVFELFEDRAGGSRADSVC